MITNHPAHDKGHDAARLKSPWIFLALAIALETAALAAGTVNGACPFSPIVADLDRSVHFYRDLLGFELPPGNPGGRVPWDTTPDLLKLHGLPKARLRHVELRIPGTLCGMELLEFAKVDRHAVRLRMQDPGAVTLILLVRDIDASFRKLKAAGVAVATTGGAPVTPSPTSKTRALIVRDPDGHFVELAQLDPLPATAVPASSNIIDVRFRMTVANLESAVRYYRDYLGIAANPGTFARSPGVAAMMGLPETVEYRLSVTTIPGSSLILEFLELRGLPAAAVRVRVQDPGAYRLQLSMDDIDSAITAMKAAGSPVISSAGAPGRTAIVQDPNNLFLSLQKR